MNINDISKKDLDKTMALADMLRKLDACSAHAIVPFVLVQLNQALSVDMSHNFVSKNVIGIEPLPKWFVGDE